MDLTGTPEPPQPPAPPASRHTRVMQTAAVGLVAGLIGGAIVVGIDHASGNSSSSSSSGSAGSNATLTAPTSTTPSPTGTPTSWVAVAARAMPGVVQISTVQTVTDQLGNSTQQAAIGTGFVIDTKGDILTNQHVISGATSIDVQFKDGASFLGKVIGKDPSSDLAVVHVNAPSSALHPLTIGHAETAQIGQPVLAIGTPFSYSESASAGIISGIGREIQSPNGFTLANALQTDAAVNHGNSGGPLLNEQGQVIGINAQIANSGVDANVGVAFAVPMDQSDRSIVNELLTKGSVSHPWLGIAGLSATAQLQRGGVTKVSSGVLVTAVAPGGPAATAGIIGGSRSATVYGTTVCTGGDVITQIGNTTINSMTDLQTLLEIQSIGASLPTKIVHANGVHATVTITLRKQPSNAPSISSTC